MLGRKSVAIACMIPLIFNIGISSYRIPQSLIASKSGGIDFEVKRDLRIERYTQLLDERVVENQERVIIEEEIKKAEEERLIEEARRIEEQESKRQYWKFEVSFYDDCYDCTQNGNGQTASGEYTQEGVTIAMPSDVPFGTTVFIEGLGYRVAQDVGGFIQYTYDDEGELVMRVDVYVETHERALELGRYYADGYIEFD